MFLFNNIFNFALLICMVKGIGIDETEDIGSRYISSVVVHRSRAFLALPRSVCTDDKEVPTLIETHWDAGHADLFSRFSQKLTRHKILSSQMWGDCHSIQDAVSLSMEPTKPKFWILDKGNEFCSPKILSYNLVFNHVSDRTELVTIEGSNLNVMVIDYSIEEDGGFRAYIGHAEENVILVFSLKNLVWWKIHMLGSSSSDFPVRADYLAISKVSPELFITAKDSLNVFSINLIQLRNLEEPHIIDSQDKSLIFNATMLGEKLGTSTGIESDFASGLIYFMVKDYAIVRWNIGYPMVAEHHDILSQSYEKFPYVSGFFTDPDGSIWVIINPRSPTECDVNDYSYSTTSSSSSTELEERLIRISTYNEITKETEFVKIFTS
ncbi:uncharacterized protein [Diabrotica undecimpunctata]|uniref:uncharacterized protein n=1 Tax=Diabrotica undecimpunctata TaxID=50387 RepID=UPI003B63E1BE